MKDYFRRLLRNLITFVIAIAAVVIFNIGLNNFLVALALAVGVILIVSLVKTDEIFFYKQMPSSTEKVIYKSEDEAPHKDLFKSESHLKALDVLTKAAESYGFENTHIEPDMYGRLNFGYRNEIGDFVKIDEIYLPSEELDPKSDEWDAIMTKILEDFEKACKKAKENK